MDAFCSLIFRPKYSIFFLPLSHFLYPYSLYPLPIFILILFLLPTLPFPILLIFCLFSSRPYYLNHSLLTSTTLLFSESLPLSCILSCFHLFSSIRRLSSAEINASKCRGEENDILRKNGLQPNLIHIISEMLI